MKKVVLQIALIINLEESESIQMIIYLLKKYNVIILIKLVGDKNEDKYYYNIFLEKGLHKDKSNTESF